MSTRSLLSLSRLKIPTFSAASSSITRLLLSDPCSSSSSCANALPSTDEPLFHSHWIEPSAAGSLASAGNPWRQQRRFFHDGRPRGPLWRGKKLIGKEALFVILGLKRCRDDDEKLDKFVKTHVRRLLKMDMIAVLIELERQEEVHLALKMFKIIQEEDWYKPDVYLYKDLIIALAKCKKMEEAMQVWESMKKDELFPDSQTYAEVIRGFLKYGSPADAMNIYEDMKKSPEPPDELPFRILLKGFLPHPLLRNRVKQDFEELFPERHIYDPPEEIFGML